MSETGGSYTPDVTVAMMAWRWQQRAERAESDLAAAQARADGLLLVVEELRAAFERLERTGPTLPSDVSETSSLRIAVGYSEMIALKDILAADPEARGRVLMAAREGTADGE